MRRSAADAPRLVLPLSTVSQHPSPPSNPPPVPLPPLVFVYFVIGISRSEWEGEGQVRGGEVRDSRKCETVESSIS